MAPLRALRALIVLQATFALRLPSVPKAPQKLKRFGIRAAAAASATKATRAFASAAEAGEVVTLGEIAAQELVRARPSPLLAAGRTAFTFFLIFSVVGAVRRRLKKRADARKARWQSFATASPSTVAEPLVEAPAVEAPAAPAVSAVVAEAPAAVAPPPAAPTPPPAPKKRKVLDVFRKKPTRATELEALLEGEDAAPAAVASRAFSAAVAGCLLAATPGAPALFATGASLAAPWARDVAVAPPVSPALAAWKDYSAAVGATSHYDLGVRETAAAKARGPADPANLLKAWRARSDAGVVSFYDFGVRLEPEAEAPLAAEDVARLDAELKTLMAAGATPNAAADAFANVVNALLVPLVDAATPSLKAADAESLGPLTRVVGLAAAAGFGFETLGLVPYAGTPVVYEGRASRSQLQSLFSRYAAASVASGLGEGEADVDIGAVDTLQAIFQISDKQADRLAQNVVTKVVQQMMEQAQAEGGDEGLLGALAGGMGGGGGGPGGMPGMPGPQDVAGQMAALRELVDSGQLTDDDKREIKKMFAESLGGGQDVDDAIRQANANKDQLDPQARECLELLNKLVV